jgi:hypothetical protein
MYMNDIELNLNINFVVKDGRANIKLLTKDGLSRTDMLSILSGGLALVIRSGDTPEKQGEMMTNVIEYLESELINVDSFSDTYFNKKIDNPKNNS